MGVDAAGEIGPGEGAEGRGGWIREQSDQAFFFAIVQWRERGANLGLAGGLRTFSHPGDQRGAHHGRIARHRGGAPWAKQAHKSTARHLHAPGPAADAAGVRRFPLRLKIAAFAAGLVVLATGLLALFTVILPWRAKLQ
ncbi:MAG TPA: hypothetical protein VIR81_14405, partial [Myxococcales bacterium]